MSVNVLTAIANIVINPVCELQTLHESRIRINNMGEALERYIKDAFSGVLASNTKLKQKNPEQARLVAYEKAFSYQGNQNNPPDIIIRNGDAIEVKKIESATASLALNSSYPKAKLFADSPMITSACRSCESWDEKDILYAVGVVRGDRLTKLFFVYGIDYAASAEIYERIKTVISSGVNTIPDVEFASTNELGRVNRVDPLGITYLRIRGMWGIENPAKVFSYVYNPINTQFEFTAIINTDKYNSFHAGYREGLEKLVSNDFKISDISIKTPDNPAILKRAKLITFYK